MRLVDENGNYIAPVEEMYGTGKEDYLQVGNYIKCKINRYRVVYKELDTTYGGGIKWNIKIVIDNPIV